LGFPFGINLSCEENKNKKSILKEKHFLEKVILGF